VFDTWQYLAFFHCLDKCTCLSLSLYCNCQGTHEPIDKEMKYQFKDSNTCSENSQSVDYGTKKSLFKCEQWVDLPGQAKPGQATLSKLSFTWHVILSFEVYGRKMFAATLRRHKILRGGENWDSIALTCILTKASLSLLSLSTCAPWYLLQKWRKVRALAT
jgi:hypothetical protein